MEQQGRADIRCERRLFHKVCTNFEVMHLVDEIQKNKNPGPGQYPHPPAIDPKGRQASWSKYSSSGACMFNPPTSARFAGGCALTLLIYIYIYIEIGKSKLPGPGTYTHINTTTENGSYFVSKFKCSGARTFGKTIRYPVGKSRVVLRINIYIYIYIYRHTRAR